MEFYHWVHGISAIILIVASIGHIYMGTAALEATFEVMQSGYCDTNWAKEHHDLWYEEVKDSAEAVPEGQTATAPAEPHKQSTDTA